MTLSFGLCIWTHKGFPWIEVAVYEGGGRWRNILWTKRWQMLGPLVKVKCDGWSSGKSD